MGVRRWWADAPARGQHQRRAHQRSGPSLSLAAGSAPRGPSGPHCAGHVARNRSYDAPMTNPATKLSWGATIGCEGGPVMVVDLPGFAQWTGAMGYAELRKIDPLRKEALADRMKTVHYWGQFTD